MNERLPAMTDSDLWLVASCLRAAATQFERDAKTHAGNVRVARQFADQAARAIVLADAFENAA